MYSVLDISQVFIGTWKWKQPKSCGDLMPHIFLAAWPARACRAAAWTGRAVRALLGRRLAISTSRAELTQATCHWRQVLAVRLCISHWIKYGCRKGDFGCSASR